jgi:tRNA (cmo5U34)-methyltransferase
MKTTHEFSFAEHATEFRKHISASIPGYADSLIPACLAYSQRFVQRDSTVLDVGCSTGHALASIREATQTARSNVEYVGIDIEPGFSEQWLDLTAKNLRFQLADARTYPGYDDVSLCLSLFTLQFIPPRDKLPLLRQIYEGLVEGGVLLIAEKTLAQTSRVQDAWTFCYYDHKLMSGFSAEEILDKERSLRGQMTLWTEPELRAALLEAGFSEIEEIWRNHMFVGFLALKQPVLAGLPDENRTGRLNARSVTTIDTVNARRGGVRSALIDSEMPTRDGSRDEALSRLVPAMMGIMHETTLSRGRLEPVKLRDGLEISAHGLGANRIMLSVCWPVEGRMQKVLSVHVTDRPELGDPEFYRYVGGSVGLLSWRRGEWENIILSHAARAGSASDLLSMFRT